MDKRDDLQKEIAELIINIKDHWDRIGTSPRIPKLEFDMMQARIRKLYEKSIIFNYLVEDPSQEDGQDKLKLQQEREQAEKNLQELNEIKRKAEEKETQDRLRQEREVAKAREEHEREKQRQETIALERIAQETRQREHEQRLEDERQERQKKASSMVSGDGISDGDQRKDDQAKITDAIPGIVSAPPSGIKASPLKMGFNDRLLFQNALFNKDAKAMSDFIFLLNEAPDLTASENIIHHHKKVHGWKDDNEALVELININRLRF